MKNLSKKKTPFLNRPYVYIKPEDVPEHGRLVKVLGVDYVHLRTRDGGDLYVTQHGLPHLTTLSPESWYYNQELHSLWERLNGSGTLYRVRTKNAKKGKIDIVVKWSRVGQDFPGRDPDVFNESDLSEFNSPFEEVSLLMEMRNSRFESPGHVRTHKPLAIYVPAERVNPDMIGRRTYKIELKMRSLDVEIDLYRNYVLIYEWVKGIDAAQASRELGLSSEYIKDLTLKVDGDLSAKGFRDHDRKPNHIIVRPKDSTSLVPCKKSQDPLYAYIDFEMLRRTPEREKWVKESKRAEYLLRQRDRFKVQKSKELPSHLDLVNILGVDYIFGHVESTEGMLWVVGRDPFLFDYFLPERWIRTPRTKISHSSEIYHTTTKDDIHIVWKVSRVGEKPVFFEQDEKRSKILHHGYNSPFEEISLALELSKQGLPTIYPRAIYRSGNKVTPSEYISDDRRYDTHKDIIMPGDRQRPALQKGYSYIIIWGYWNGPDELLAVRDGEYYSGINLMHAHLTKVISQETFDELMRRENEKLVSMGIEDLNLRAEHFMISLDHKGNLIAGADGKPEVRCCNFEFLRRLAP